VLKQEQGNAELHLNTAKQHAWIEISFGVGCKPYLQTNTYRTKDWMIGCLR